MGWTMDQDGNWTSDTPEIDREDEARRDWERLKREEEDFLRNHRIPNLQEIPDSEREEDKPRTPTPDEIQSIIDDMDDRPAPRPHTPYLH